MATNNNINTGKPIEVVNGGTQKSSFTAYAPICGGTTTTNPLQSASSGQSNVGYVLTSNGSASLPSWQASGSFSGQSNFKVTTNNNTPIPNLTGDGTNPVVVWPQIMWDVGSNYDTGSGAFTAPATGYYFFYANILFQGIDSTHTNGGFVVFNKNGVLGQNNNTADTNIYAASVSSGATPNYNSTSNCMVIQLNAGDYVQIRVQWGSGGSPKTVGISPSDLSATPAIVSSHFGGFRIA